VKGEWSGVDCRCKGAGGEFDGAEGGGSEC